MGTDQTCTLTATGDLMFYGPLAERMAAERDLLWGFRPVASVLRHGDILFGNLETPISKRRENEPDASDKYFSPPGIAHSLKELGFDVVNLAHNHIYDFGAEGVEATTGELGEAGLPYIGIGTCPGDAARPSIIEGPGGITLGFLGYTTANNALDPKHTYVACFPDPERVARDIADLKGRVDVVVVSCHTGSQYNPYPAPETRELANRVIESGASVFLGHHPHVPQGCERIRDGLAVYSLGDFVAPVHNEQARRTFFVRIHLSGSRVVGHDVVACYITDACQTVLAQGDLKREIEDHVSELSTAIAEGHSGDLHFRTARSRFFSQYVRSWITEWRTGGPRVFFRKIRNLRWYHIQLLGRIVLGRLAPSGRRRRAHDK